MVVVDMRCVYSGTSGSGIGGAVVKREQRIALQALVTAAAAFGREATNENSRKATADENRNGEDAHATTKAGRDSTYNARLAQGSANSANSLHGAIVLLEKSAGMP